MAKILEMMMLNCFSKWRLEAAWQFLLFLMISLQKKIANVLDLSNWHNNRTEITQLITCRSCLFMRNIAMKSIHATRTFDVSFNQAWRERGGRGGGGFWKNGMRALLVPSANSSGSLGVFVCVKCCRMVDTVPIWHIISIL